MFTQFTDRYFNKLDQYLRLSFRNIPDEKEFGVMLRYAMGWVDENDHPYDKPTGKRLRPALLLLCNEATGGDWQQAIPAAAAIEILHNFSLIHDDIQDGSLTRHGRPTVWQIWGISNAINAGDAMFALSYSVLESLAQTIQDADLTLSIWRIFNRTNIELTRGQHLDMRFENLEAVATNEYISMIQGKSAALLSASAEIGALIATGNPAIASQYAEFGRNMGIAFQIRDDILGIWGDPDTTGKSAATDIISRKKSLPILYGLEHSAELVQLYQQPTSDDDHVERILELLNEVRAWDFAQSQEYAYHQKAMEALQQTNSGTPAFEVLLSFVDALFQRIY